MVNELLFLRPAPSIIVSFLLLEMTDSLLPRFFRMSGLLYRRALPLKTESVIQPGLVVR